MLLKHYSWPRRYSSASCHWFFLGLGLPDVARRGANCEAAALTPLGWTQWTSCTSLSWSVVGLKLDQQVVRYWKMTWKKKYWIQISLSFILGTSWLHHISYQYCILIILVYNMYIYTYIICHRCVMNDRNCLGSGCPSELLAKFGWCAQGHSGFWRFCAIDTRSLAFGSRKLSGDLQNLKQKESVEI